MIKTAIITSLLHFFSINNTKHYSHSNSYAAHFTTQQAIHFRISTYLYDSKEFKTLKKTPSKALNYLSLEKSKIQELTSLSILLFVFITIIIIWFLKQEQSIRYRIKKDGEIIYYISIERREIGEWLEKEILSKFEVFKEKTSYLPQIHNLKIAIQHKCELLDKTWIEENNIQEILKRLNNSHQYKIDVYYHIDGNSIQNNLKIRAFETYRLFLARFNKSTSTCIIKLSKDELVLSFDCILQKIPSDLKESMKIYNVNYLLHAFTDVILPI